MINTVVTDLIDTTQRNIDSANPGSIDDVRTASRTLVGFSDEIYAQHASLKKFLNQHLYRHEKKLAMTREVQAMVKELFAIYMSDILQMPLEFSAAAAEQDEVVRARVVADYIAGMTDRYAISEHERITA
jgi:dGTPase